MTENKNSKQFNVFDYCDKYDKDFLEVLTNYPLCIQVENMREFLYGYVFTDDYDDGIFPEEMCMDYWEGRHCLKDEMPPCSAPTVKEEYDEEDDLENIYPELSDSGYEIIDEVLDEYTDEIKYAIDFGRYEVETLQERCILEAIDSTGDGKSAETALCVTSVDMENEYLSRVFPYCHMSQSKRTVSEEGIACVEFEKNAFGVDRIFFDLRTACMAGHNLESY